jgi:phosphoribosylaminoimidazolecarboxamide formyltransferase/IMP cyclohydrolase
MVIMMAKTVPHPTALISVSDKAGIVDLAKKLTQLGFRILSTGGTAKLLNEVGLKAIEVSTHTGQPEILNGRVKTLHPKIHGGILARRSNTTDMEVLEASQIDPIDIVVVNLYPFEATIKSPNTTWDEAIEQIDIGGPAMVRASAKNHQDVTIITDPADYATLLKELEDSLSKSGKAITSLIFRKKMAQKAFAHTARYDACISQYLWNQLEKDQEAPNFPKEFSIGGQLQQPLRYGENPHQHAALYQSNLLNTDVNVPTLLDFEQLQGKELSFNNIVDADAAWGCVRDLFLTHKQPACVIIKHANPCGVALGSTSLEAYQKAFKTDPTSAFGGIIAFNHPVDAVCVQAITQQFLEVLIAPEYTPEALELIKSKVNVRVLRIPIGTRKGFEFKQVDGGFLIQNIDQKVSPQATCRIVSQKQPSPDQWNDLLFANQVAKWVKSNAIIFVKNGVTLGIGAGQMSRVDSAKIAAIKAEQAGLSLTNCVAASDAFFPFRDGLDVLVKHGACAIIAPGGSVRDDEVIAAANEQSTALIFTGVRHFKH